MGMEDAETMDSPFHEGERYVQHRAGVREDAEELGQGMIRPVLPDAFRAFFAGQPLVYVAAEDADGLVWATALGGQPGHLVRSPDPRHLVLATSAPAGASGDPVVRALATPGARVGLLGLELHTRRRIRANGTVTAGAATVRGTAKDGSAPIIAIDQCFGNCPKYIQARLVVLDEQRLRRAAADPTNAPSAEVASGGAVLSALGCALVGAADTFFLATTTGRANVAAGGRPRQAAARGADMSHRGGAPGFVTVSHDVDDAGAPSGTVLSWPDYEGNGMFNSLGNLVANPAAGLLFVDWATGDALQLSGQGTVQFAAPPDVVGGERTVVFSVKRWRFVAGALPIQPAPLLQPSPYNPRTVRSATTAGGEWIQCVAVRDEAAEDVKTFEFSAPPSLRSAPPAPGQYATFDLDLPQGRRFNRTWTVSRWAADRFSITVKRAGVVSTWMHASLRPGGRVLFRGTGGGFVPDASSRRPVLYVAGGIGITPFRPMLAALAARGIPATLVYSVQTPADAVFLDEFAAAYRPDQLAVAVTATRSAPPSWPGRRGRVDASMLRGAAPGYAGMDIYVCGPTPFMEAVITALARELDHPHMDRVFVETFDF